MHEEKRSTILSIINNPLSFFALALLISEGFLGIVLVFAKEPHPIHLSFWGMWIGAGMFILVILIVAILTWSKPDALGLSGKDYSDMKQKESELQSKQSIVTVREEDNIVADSEEELKEFQTIEKSLVWNSRSALLWFKNQNKPVDDNLFFGTFSLPFPPPPDSTGDKILNEKNAVLSALKNNNLLETTEGNKLQTTTKGKRFLNFINFK